VDYSDLMVQVMYCKPLRSLIANKGKPIGLARYARNRRIKPFCQEYVARTVIPNSIRSMLAKPKIKLEQEISPMQMKVNKSTNNTMGNNITLTIAFI